MNRKFRALMIVLAGIALLTFVACQGDTPTAPQGGGNGGNPAPQPTTLDVTVSNPTPVINSSTNITATATANNNPVANGTAVEFSTDFGTFTDTGAASTIKTTSGGSATATLTSATAGTAKVTVRVGNIFKNVNVTFKETGGGTGPAPTITALNPNTGSPSGGQQVTITGTNFTGNVHVLFGGKEAAIVSVTPTQIVAVTPAIDLGATEQVKTVAVTVITNAGTQNENSVTQADAFQYQLEILTPIIYSVSPSSGPNEGHTRIAIFGEGFQPPTRVFFGTGGSAGGPLTDEVELNVSEVRFGQIIADTPPASGLGSALKDQQVTMRVLNVRTNKDTVQARAFRYGPTMAITAAGPTEGSPLGGTQVTIHGWGFDDPVAVSIGGVAAQPIRVSGTEIVAVTSPVQVSGCSDKTGPITVTNIEDGNSAEGPTFTYIAPKATILSVTPNPASAGGTITVVVSGSSGFARFQIGTATVTPSAVTVSGGTATFTLTVPTTLTFQQQSCPGGGSAPIPTTFDVVYTDLSTACTDTLTNGLTVNPPAVAEAVITPTTLSMTATIPAGGTTTCASGTFTVSNSGTAPLTITSISVPATPAGFTVSPEPQTTGAVTLNTCDALPVAVTFCGAAGTYTTTVSVTTSAGTQIVPVSVTINPPTP